MSPGATRFVTNFLMVARVLDMKEALKQTITDVEWGTYVRILFNMQRKPIRTQEWMMRKLILDNCGNTES